MAAEIRRFSSRADRLRQDQAEQARRALLQARGLFIGDDWARSALDKAVSVAVEVIDLQTAPTNERAS